MTLGCLVFPFAYADGPANMALDEVLLERVAALGDTAALRTYGWSTPTLSLGYFQHLSAMNADARWTSVPVVRRATGGGAIWHHHELTYALVLPSRHPRALPHTGLYHSVHAAIAEVLRRRGVVAVRRGEPSTSPPQEDPSRRPFLCFADRDPADLVCGAYKVVGSAQRRRAGAILQHGSILLKRSATTPEFPGLADLFPVDEAPDSWADDMVEAIASALELHTRTADMDGPMSRRAAEIEREVYRDPGWTGRRR